MITSMNNPQVKWIQKLQKKGKARQGSRAFVVEGIKMFQEAPKDWVESIYVSERFASEKASLLEGMAYETLSDAVFAHASDTVTPQGILCIVKMPEYCLEDILGNAGKPALLLATEGIQDPGNLGTIFRTAEGAGATGILMDRSTVDIFHPKTIRSTMGSIYRMPFVVASDLAGTVGVLKEKGIRFFAAHLKGDSFYDEPDYREPSAFFVGNEGNGLSDGLARLADVSIRIPMEGELESLNAAMAAGILLYEASRQRRQ